MVGKIAKQSTVDKAFNVLNEINQKIYNGEQFSLTEVISKHGVTKNAVSAIKKRNLLTSCGKRKFKWTNGMISQDTPMLRKYASWVIQDANEYQREYLKKRQSKKQQKITTEIGLTSGGSIVNTTKFMKVEETQVNDGFTVITKETLLKLGEITSFQPFTVRIGQCDFFQVNSCHIKQGSSFIIIKLRQSVDDVMVNLGIIRLEDKKLYFFKKDALNFELK